MPDTRPPIRLALVGVGNCASSLVQGIHAYRTRGPADLVGLMHPEIGPYRVTDVEVVAAFDVDARKVGKDLRDAVFAPPNNTMVLAADLPATGVIVRRGPVLDGVAPHMADHPPERTFVVAAGPEPTAAEVTAALRASGAQLMVICTSSGKLITRAVAWMDTVKKFFGVLMLCFAAWMFARIVT